MPTTTPVFSAQLMGRTEKSLNAILGQLLASSGVTEPQWVALTLAVTGGGGADRDAYTGQVAHALRVSENRAGTEIRALVTAHLLDLPAGGAPVIVTEPGRQFYDRTRTATAEVIQQMWGDLPAADLEAAGRVLSIILGRADAYLASASGDSAETTARRS